MDRTPSQVRVSLRSPVRENRTQGSARGAPGNGCPYLNRSKNWAVGTLPESDYFDK